VAIAFCNADSVPNILVNPFILAAKADDPKVLKRHFPAKPLLYEVEVYFKM
jgi:hypothetical protein